MFLFSRLSCCFCRYVIFYVYCTIQYKVYINEGPSEKYIRGAYIATQQV